MLGITYKNTGAERKGMLITISNIYDMGQACKGMLEGLRKRVVVGQDKWTREQQKRYMGDLSSFFNILTTFNL